jgi:excisionase family DNA binding protein
MERDLYSIEEARERLGGIARNTIYELIRSGELGSVLIKRRRFISAGAIAAYIAVTESTEPPSPQKLGLGQVVQMRLGLRPSVARSRTHKAGR